MSTKKGKLQKTYVAKLADGDKNPCVFCRRAVDDEVIYGKLYVIGDIQCHYFCVLLSCCLIQKGSDEEGLFGFLYRDILAEVERSKKHKCSYCSRDGATLGCSVSQCRKQFHLPCGREHQAVSLYYGNYKSFCSQHAPKQKLTKEVESKVKQRAAQARKQKKTASIGAEATANDPEDPELVCVICYEQVDGRPSTSTFWPPCCARDKWLHRTCLEVMALSAGMHYLKCPLCNDKEVFYEAVVTQGIYVPDRDAAWELEQNAFADMYVRPVVCDAEECRCPMGRKFDEEAGEWDIQLCLLCGSGIHPTCRGNDEPRYVCPTCLPHAPEDLETLDLIPIPTPVSDPTIPPSGPPMPSRMSLRRTKGLPPTYRPSTSKNPITNGSLRDDPSKEASETTQLTREDLNLKPPRRLPTHLDPAILQSIENKLKPAPLSKKLKALNALLEECKKNSITKLSPAKEWNSPKKTPDLNAVKDFEDVIIIEQDEIIIDITDETDTHTIADLVDNNRDQNDQDVVEVTPSHIKQQVIGNANERCDENIEIANDSLQKHETDSNKCTPKKIKQYTNAKLTIKYKTSVSPIVICPNNEINVEKVNIKDDNQNVDNIIPSNEVNKCSGASHSKVMENLNNTTPRKSKTINISKDSSLEISENDESINIDVVKLDQHVNKSKNCLRLVYPSEKSKCAFKINQGKDTLGQQVNIDLESFKNQYLNEVGRDFKCKFNHNHVDSIKTSKLRTPLDFAVNATTDLTDKSKNLKRKSTVTEDVEAKKPKLTKRKRIKRRLDTNENRKCIGVKRKNGKKLKTNKSAAGKDHSSNNKWKFKPLNVKMERNKRLKRLKKAKRDKVIEKSKLQQYILKYPTNSESPGNDVIAKPSHTVTPLKRKYKKNEKTPDNLKQTSISNFFTIKLE